MARQIVENLTTEVCGEYDVVVAGGGVAGVAAALAAARYGAKTLLVEKLTVLGGLATAGNITIYLPLCDGMGNKVIGGIAEELLWEAIRYGGGDLPPEWAGRPARAATVKRYRTRFNATAFVLALDRLVGEAGVDLLLDTVCCVPIMEKGECRGVIVENKSGRQAYLGKAVVDATGDADLLTRAGVPCAAQDNFLAYWAYGLTMESLKAAVDRQNVNSLLKLIDLGSNTGKGLPEGSPKYYGTGVREVTGFLLKSRELALAELLRRGPEQMVFASLPSMPQLRTTRRLRGEYVMTPDDIGKCFEDSVGCIGDWRQAGPVYEVPYRALYSGKVKNGFAAGRNISASGDTWEITRVIPVAAATGQAAGIAAALVSESGDPADGVDLRKLQQILTKDGILIHKTFK